MTDTDNVSEKQAIETIEAEDDEEIRAVLPDDVHGALTKRAFSPGAIRKLLRDTHYLGPIGIGRGGWIGMYGGGQPGTEMRRPHGALYHFPRSWRFAALERGLKLGLITHVGDGRFATTERGVAVLRRVDMCAECGEPREPHIYKSWYQASPMSGAQTSSEFVTHCPECGSDGYGGRGSNSGSSYVEFKLNATRVEYRERVTEGTDAAVYGVVSFDEVPDATADEVPEVDEDEIAAILDEHVEHYVPGTPRETFKSATEDPSGRPAVTINSAGENVRFAGTDDAIVVSRTDREAEVHLRVDDVEAGTLIVDMSYDVAVERGAKDRLDVNYNVVDRSWDGERKSWLISADGISAVVASLTSTEWGGTADSGSFEVTIEREAIELSEYPVLGVDEAGELISNDHLTADADADEEESEDEAAACPA